MRITDKTKVEFTILGDPAGLQISPLLFLPFIENAFKYGVSTREMSPIVILLEIKKDRIFLEVVNNRHASSNMKSADNTGIGINNTRRRLDLIYPGRYQLDIEGSEKELFGPSAQDWLPAVRNIVIELHGGDCSDRFFSALEGYDYDLVRSDKEALPVVACRNLRARADRVIAPV